LEVESKGGMFADALRPTEQGKINCAKQHFEDVSGDTVKCFAVDNYEQVTRHF